MQMIYLMDTLIKRMGGNAQLTVYKVLAYGSTDGIMECVPDSETVQYIFNK